MAIGQSSGGWGVTREIGTIGPFVSAGGNAGFIWGRFFQRDSQCSWAGYGRRRQLGASALTLVAGSAKTVAAF